jgi:hypothetical protein
MFFRDTSIRNATIRYWAGGATRNRLIPLKGDTLEILFKQLKYFIDKIKSRGGQVFIVRPPSGGSVLARENKLWPREQYWNRLLEYIQIPGLYYTDYPEISGMVCPEESHLTPADAVIFTRTLVNVLQTKAGWKFRGPTDSIANRLKQ